MDILRLTDKYPNVKYVLSKDAKCSPHFLKKHGIDPAVRERILYVTANETYELDGMKIQTLLSTDAGVAFSVDVDGKKIYHAGDLHNWKWDGVGELINGKMERSYKHALGKLEDDYFDLAFVVLDPRLEKYKFKGLEYFLKTIAAKYVFPMHMWQEYGLIDEYLSHIANPSFIGRIMKIEQEDQTWELD